MAIKRSTYKVIIDTSNIYGKPIRRELVDLIKEFKASNKVEISFFVPEIVYDETLKHYLDDYVESISKYESVSKDLKSLVSDLRLPHLKYDTNELKAIVKNAFKKNYIKLLKTPFKKINWQNLTQRAIFREPPFDKYKEEKGFKDALIAETIISHLSKLATNSNLVIIVNDVKLREYLVSKTKKYEKLKFYNSIPEFSSSLKLQILEGTDELIEALTREAESAFYNAFHPDSLFYKSNIPKLINEKYTGLLANPPIEEEPKYGAFGFLANDEKWLPVSEPVYSVSAPVFIEKKGDVYHWQTTVVYQRIFERYLDKFYYENKVRGKCNLEFRVRWGSHVERMGKIDSNQCTILELDYIPSPFSPSTSLSPSVRSIRREIGVPPWSSNLLDTDRRLSGMTSGATLSGMGTVPVSISPSLSPSLSSSPSPSEPIPEAYIELPSLEKKKTE